MAPYRNPCPSIKEKRASRSLPVLPFFPYGKKREGKAAFRVSINSMNLKLRFKVHFGVTLCPFGSPKIDTFSF
jgi:hypothetical protein